MFQDLKNTKNNLKKMAKSLEKEQEKLVELEATPDKLSKEVEQLKKKLVILEVRGGGGGGGGGVSGERGARRWSS